MLVQFDFLNNVLISVAELLSRRTDKEHLKSIQFLVQTTSRQLILLMKLLVFIMRGEGVVEGRTSNSIKKHNLISKCCLKLAAAC